MAQKKNVSIIIFAVLAVTIACSTATVTAAYGWNFAAAGDWGCTSNTDRTVQNIERRDPERVLGLGDYSYRSTPDCWLDAISPLNSDMRISIGNHDDETSSLLNAYMDHFNLQRQFYSFDYRNAHFLVLSTEQVSSSTQLEFATADLRRASSNSNIDWIFVYMHKPMYTSPSNHGPNAEMRDKYHPIFDRYDVDIVLYGHNHNYERSYPIRYDSVGNPATPIVTTRETRNYDDPRGVIFITVGTGGKSLYEWDGKASFIVKQQDDRYGFIDIAVGNSDDRLTARYFVNTSDGPVQYDRFTISK